MKKVIFIGNRINVLREVFNEPTWEVIKIFAVAGSSLSQHLHQTDIPFHTFNFKDKKSVVDEIQSLDFDILVSNGCPFILPISEMSSPSRMFINTHPSLLPALKGPHPINGLFLLNHERYGATTHYMLDDVDSGRIIQQVNWHLTKDLDLGLVYRLSFLAEGIAFSSAIHILKQNNYEYLGTEHSGVHSYYKRQPLDQVANCESETATEIESKVKAFGISSLGVDLVLANNEHILVFEANKMNNPQVEDYYGRGPAGTITLEYEGNFLIKCREGLLRVSKWS